MKKKSLNAKKIIHKNLIEHLKNKKINKIYKKFERNIQSLDGNSSFVAAISGGSDSLALAFFLKCYSLKHKKKIYYCHVDHKLRKESGLEAKKIKKILKKKDINCKILFWKGKKPSSNIQSRARQKRYDLLERNIYKKKVSHILTAHHFDDLNENFFIRMTRGSGLEGLVSFNSINTEYNKKVNILRPLLNIKKRDLEFISEKVFKFYVKDPSNESIRFKRVRIRNLIKQLSEEGLDTNKILLTINNLTESNIAINYFVKQNLINNTKILENGRKCLIDNCFFQNPNEIIFRSLSNILSNVGKKYYPPRGKSITQLINRMHSSNFKKTTLSRCVIEKVNNYFIISEES